MKREISTLKAVSGSAKKKLLMAFRLISGLGKEYSNISLTTPVFTRTPHEPFSLTSARARALSEAEQKKAQALMYLRMSDMPK